MTDDNLEVLHVIPINDLYEHDTRPGMLCPCNPQVDPQVGAALIIHNAFDGRQITENLIQSNN